MSDQDRENGQAASGSPSHTTNITPKMIRDFEALRNPEYDNFALVSCFADGVATAAIAAVTPYEGEGGEVKYRVQPMFIVPTPGMVLTDHDGVVASGAAA